MDRIPLSVGDDRSAPSSARAPSFYLNITAAEQALYERGLEEMKNLKSSLADLLDPLIKDEAAKFPHIRKLPASTDVVEDLIQRIGGPKAREENAHTGPIPLNCLKQWLTRACNNAKDETTYGQPK